MFLDEAIITVQGGNGGRGCVGWRREKFIPKGGPDGGDGGRGGNVVFCADANTDTLSSYASRKEFEAANGNMGSGNNRHGKDGEDLCLLVPPGTVLRELHENGTESIIADLQEPGDQCIAAFGGRGGFGNAHFVSSVRQRPDFAELGEPGEQKRMKLELKLVADVGIIGLPSVGKSTLISVISNARPKIADYPFTTLIPNLGVAMVHDHSIVVCDVPGLIEGASEGKGLGDLFLRHIERTGVLLHILDLSHALGQGNSIDIDTLEQDYRAIRHELETYSPLLSAKRELIVLNKIDLVGGNVEAVVWELGKRGIPIFLFISSATKQNTDVLLEQLLPIVHQERERRSHEHMAEEGALPLPVLRPQEDSSKMGAYRIEQKNDGSVVIYGKRLEQFTKMTNFESRGGVERFRDVIERIGLKKALKPMWKDAETPVYIGGIRVDEYF